MKGEGYTDPSMECPICSFSDIRSLQNKRRAFFHCPSCGFFWADPASRLSVEEQKNRYELHQNDGSNQGYGDYINRIIDKTLDWALKDTFPGSRVHRVVDWGSGPSDLASQLLRQRGLDVVSWDPLFAPDHPPQSERFDVALCIEVAEHFDSPVKDFLALAATLKPGGRLVVHTHFAPEREEDFLSWWYIEDTTHVSFYSPRALKLLSSLGSLVLEELEDQRFAVFRRPLPVLVVGGINMDIEGRPSHGFIPRDSNPGTVRFSPGGAGRNIAENLARLKIPVELVGALGDDGAGKDCLESCRGLSVGVGGCEIVKGAVTSCYLSILDDQGDMTAAIAGMEIYDRFTPELVRGALEKARTEAFQRSFGADPSAPFSALVVDGNLLPQAIEAVVRQFPRLPVWFDPVSTQKALRVVQYQDGSLLRSFYAIKPNGIEAQRMAEALGRIGSPILESFGSEGSFLPPEGVPEQTTRQPMEQPTEQPPGCVGAGAEVSLARLFHRWGIPLVLISLGERGVLYSKKGRRTEAPSVFRPPAARVVSATGAGDAFVAAALRYTLLNPKEEEQSAKDLCAHGSAASVITLETVESVAPTLCAEALEGLVFHWGRTNSYF